MRGRLALSLCYSSAPRLPSEIQKLLRDKDHVTAADVGCTAWRAPEDWPHIEDLRVVFASYEANEFHLFQVCLWSEPTRLHDRFEYGSRSFKDDFARLLNGTGNDYRYGPALYRNEDFAVLKLRFIEPNQLSLQLADTLPSSSNVSDQREAQFPVGPNLLGLVQLRCPRERDPDGISSDQNTWCLSGQRSH